ncbi:hypothetical protein [Luethyella okanaganae]|uniref:Uncharacterized protein n=1 Tax=Luethyella okanaganae TaxID=69372 RepID=A0ABW1VDS0_9MICO
MTDQTRRKRTMTRCLAGAVAGLLAAVALVVATATPASAISSVSVTPNSGSAQFSTTITVNDTEVGHTYRVGLCSRTSFSGVPACAYLGITFTGTGGPVTHPITLTETFTNTHYGVGFPCQPLTHYCDGNLCEIAVTDNDSSSTYWTYKTAITFT